MRREQAELGAGAPRRTGNLGSRCENRLHDVELPVGLSQSRSARTPVVEDERTFVHFGEETGTDKPVRHDSRKDQHHCRGRRPARVTEHRAQRALVGIGDRLDAAPDGRQDAALFEERRRLGISCGEELCAQQRNQGERKEERDQDRDRQRDGKSLEELTLDAGEQAKRQEHHHGGDGRRRDGPEQLLHCFTDGNYAIRIEVHVPDDILGDHHRVIDHQPDGDRHRAERHQVERLPSQGHHEHRDGEGQRDRRCADRGDACVPQEEEQHDHGECGANQHRVAYRVDRLPDQRRLIVERLEMHAGR